MEGLTYALHPCRGLYWPAVGDDPWCEAIRRRVDVLRQRPLTRSELWTINKLLQAVIGRVLGLDPRKNVAANQEEACRKIEANNRGQARLPA